MERSTSIEERRNVKEKGGKERKKEKMRCARERERERERVVVMLGLIKWVHNFLNIYKSVIE